MPTATSVTMNEPSDLPSLRRQHVTAGYRDGVTVMKMAHVQDGFDGGYPVGAEMGVRVGIVLGVLEGIVNADADGSAKVGKVLEEVRRELDVRSVFGGAMGETFADGQVEGQGEVNVKERSTRAGEEVIARWEGRVEALLATLK